MKRITLTFDNGPHLSGTPHILETLAARSLKATFCLVGERLREPALRALAARAKAEGHRIANHTMTHGAPLGRRSGASVPEEEIGAAQAMLGDLAERRLFRPNGDEGLLSEFVLSEAAVDYLALHRYTVIIWNCVPRDSALPADSWVARALDTIHSQPWTLLVLHDHCTEASQHLGPFLDGLIAEGYEFSQEFPEDTVLMRDGVRTAALRGLVAPAPH